MGVTGRPLLAATAQRFLIGCALVSAALVWAASAQAGYGVQPANGTTTGTQPTFLVYLDSQDSIPLVYVSSSPQMDSSGFPASELGSCVPTTPFGEPDKYTCQPPLYFTGGYGSSLPPGTYYWWMTFLRQDPGQPFATIHISGPFQFTVAQPTAPTGVYLSSPSNGATVSTTPTLSANVPGSAQVSFYVSLSSEANSDGTPLLGADAGCSGATTNAGLYSCNVDAGSLYPGQVYYWWVVVNVGGTPWRYGPQSFTTSDGSGGGSGVGTGSVGSTGSGGAGGTTTKPAPAPRTIADAPKLRPSAHYTGQSIRQTKLGDAAYALSKALGRPKTIDVACWSVHDWTSISGQNPESNYTLLGFYLPLMPHWLELSPGICRSMETLLYHRPKYTNHYTADAVDTLTHEMIHALGITKEAQTECYAMQLSYVTAVALGLPIQYAENLGRLNLINYAERPPKYIDRIHCREGGSWDLFPTKPSLPWHLPPL